MQDGAPKIAELVNITPISLGLMVDRYIYSSWDDINQQT